MHVEDLRTVSPAELEGLVRDALLHLYDIAHLQTHPLAQALDCGSDGNRLRGKLLLQALVDAIESLRPPPGTSATARAWRTYRLLELRYLEGSSVDEILDQLAISKTQYRRDHARALEAVTSLLRDRLGLGPSGLARRVESESRAQLALSEAEQLAVQLSSEHVDLAEVLRGLLSLLASVAAESRIALTLSVDPALPAVYGDRMAMRQIFLGLLNLAFQHAVEGRLEVSVAVHDRTIEVAIVASSTTGTLRSAIDAEGTSLEVEVARRFVDALGGKLAVVAPVGSGPWMATVVLPIARQPLVLVLDNQPDFIDLVGRYLAEHDWRVVGARNVREAQSLAIDREPNVILLDVMLPGQDGWELLLALKARPETRRIPVIVCSVLYEPQVARALGAVDYLAKPVSQAALLKALVPWRQGMPGRGPSC